MQQNPSERMRCKFNTAMDMCLYGQYIMNTNISLLVHIVRGLRPVKT